MKNVVNVTGIHSVDFIKGRKGNFRAIVKVKAGFMTIVDDLGIACNWSTGPQWKSALEVFKSFKKGALHTIEFKAEGSDTWLNVFARKGNKVVLMDTQLFEDMKVGDINQDWSNTNLYNYQQYKAVNATNWASNAFVINEGN
jgi:hypothetical protein